MSPGWWIYILRCSDGRRYVGASPDPERRLRQHNGEIAGGARFTQKRRPSVLVYVEFIGDKILTLRVEWRLKRASAEWKRALIRGEHSGLSLRDLVVIPIAKRRRRARRRKT